MQSTPQSAPDIIAFTLALIGAGSALVGFISLLVMFFYSIWRIEREMKRDGLPRPCAWDFTGYRAVIYGAELLKSHEKLAKSAENGVPNFYGLDPRNLLSYVRPIDRLIARLAFFGPVLAGIFGGAMLLYQRYFIPV